MAVDISACITGHVHGTEIRVVSYLYSVHASTVGPSLPNRHVVKVRNWHFECLIVQ